MTRTIMMLAALALPLAACGKQPAPPQVAPTDNAVAAKADDGWPTGGTATGNSANPSASDTPPAADPNPQPPPPPADAMTDNAPAIN